VRSSNAGSRALDRWRVLLAWPQFFLDASDGKRWTDFDELFGSSAELVSRSEGRFTNGGETLFEAVRCTPVDFMGKTRKCGVAGDPISFDLSRYVLSDEGFFGTRDELFARFGSLGQIWRGRLFEAILSRRRECPL